MTNNGSRRSHLRSSARPLTSIVVSLHNSISKLQKACYRCHNRRSDHTIFYLGLSQQSQLVLTSQRKQRRKRAWPSLQLIGPKVGISIVLKSPTGSALQPRFMFKQVKDGLKDLEYWNILRKEKHKQLSRHPQPSASRLYLNVVSHPARHRNCRNLLIAPSA